DYTAGWQYLVLLPLSLVALWRKGIPGGLRIALLPLLGFGLAMFSATQYWRYLFPVMPIAAVVLAVLFMGENRAWRVLCWALALLCIVLNSAFFPRVSWMTAASPQMAYTPAGRTALTGTYAPAAMLTAEVNRLAPNARVL